MFMIITKQMGGNNKSFDCCKRRAKLHDSQKKVTFNEVAGLKKKKEELETILQVISERTKLLAY